MLCHGLMYCALYAQGTIIFINGANFETIFIVDIINIIIRCTNVYYIQSKSMTLYALSK